MVLITLAAAVVAAAVPDAPPVSAPVLGAPAKAGDATKPAAKSTATVAQVTPVAERVATLMALDKRTGVTQSFAIKPGAQVAFGSLTIRLRSCETTPEWEQKATAAFLQIDEKSSASAIKRVYSGWMFAESPSLNPLQNPRYDVWVKSCAMNFPATGAETVVASRAVAGAKKPVSSAPKSPEPATAEAN